MNKTKAIREMKSQKVYKTDFHLSPFTAIILAVLILYSLSLIVVYLWGVLTTFKSLIEFQTLGNVVGFPKKFVFDNYIKFFKEFQLPANNKIFYFEGLLLNSLLYAVICAVVNTATCCFVGYLTAKFDYRFSRFVNIMVIVLMTIPVVGSDISMIQLMHKLNLYDTFLGSWIQKLNFLNMYYLVFYAAFKAIPKDFSEAAYVDGASESRVFLKIMLPMMASMFFTIFLLSLIGFWNDYQVPLLFLPSHPTLSFAIYMIANSSILQEFSSTPIRLAACVVTAMFILIVFLLFRERIMSKVSLGGIKE